MCASYQQRPESGILSTLDIFIGTYARIPRDMCRHIEAQTKWPPFCRRPFQIYFILLNRNFDSNSIEICSYGSNLQPWYQNWFRHGHRNVCGSDNGIMIYVQGRIQDLKLGVAQMDLKLRKNGVCWKRDVGGIVNIFQTYDYDRYIYYYHILHTSNAIFIAMLYILSPLIQYCLKKILFEKF